MMYEKLAWLIIGVCLGVLASLMLFCGHSIEGEDVSFLIKDFMGYKDVHLIKLI